MKRAKGRKGQGKFRPDPKRDQLLVDGIREFMGMQEVGCQLRETKDGDLYLYQSAPEFHGTEEELAERREARRKNPSQQFEPLGFDEHILIQRVSRAEAIRWAMEMFLPHKLRREVKILSEEEAS